MASEVMKNGSTATKMVINYNPHNNSHFLLLQDYVSAVVLLANVICVSEMIYKMSMSGR
jgi:hypothetical protein